VSPFVVRRYRAERLLRDEFEALRATVLGVVAGRLRSCGVHLDRADLEECYSQAWQGLYAAVLDGERIDNTSAWLALVTYRRAIDEHRARRALAFERLAEDAGATAGAPRTRTTREHDGAEQDIAARLDDRARLRQLFEALRVQLTAREQQAATLCYLQGLSRAEAAARMGVSESRMRKLMEGRGARSPGVASKMGALVQTIASDRWCEEQGSLMRGLAYGILDPEGERHRLAMLHRDACPACRAYVLSLRGLAAVLPPVPMLLHWALGAGTSGLAGAGAGAAAHGAGRTLAPGGSASAPGAAGTSLGGGALAGPGAAGASAAGGGWWLAGGPFGAKLAVSCLVALGVGAGCAALGGPQGTRVRPDHRRGAVPAHAGPRRAYESSVAAPAPATGEAPSGRAREVVSRVNRPVPAAAQAGREFGPEQSTAGYAAGAAKAGAGPATASAASVERPPVARATTRPAAGGGAAAGTGPPAAAQREFAPG
jgi:RNA polymerase sigma factor (sigma-70 family)